MVLETMGSVFSVLLGKANARILKPAVGPLATTIAFSGRPGRVPPDRLEHTLELRPFLLHVKHVLSDMLTGLALHCLLIGFHDNCSTWRHGQPCSALRGCAARPVCASGSALHPGLRSAGL